MDIKKLLLVGFALSGMAALIYEVVWFRPLQLILGSSVYAVSTMLTAFMAGFALGSYLFSGYADKVKNPLRLFAFLELGIAIYGVLILFLFNLLPYPYMSLWEMFHTNFNLFIFMQFLLVFVVLIIPTTLMGATWPVVNKAFVKKIGRLGKGVGELYSVNSIGAIIGSFAAGFILIPLIGIFNSSIFAALLNFIVALTIRYYARD